MATSALSQAQLAQLRKQLPRLEAEIAVLTKDSELMLRLIENLDARLLLKRANESVARALVLRSDAQRLIPQALSLMNAMPKKPPVVQARGKITAHIDVGDVKAQVQRLPKRLAALDNALRRYERGAQQKLNEPGRWGDASALPDSVARSFELANVVLEVIEKLLRKYR